MSEMRDHEVFTAFLNKYIGLSHGMRFDEKRAMWDLDEPTPVLSPEEVMQPLIGWPAIERYWGETRESIESLSTEWWDLHVQRLSPDFALLLFKQRWRAIMIPASIFSDKHIASTVRVSMGVRKLSDEWRIIFSVESHVDGVVYFRALYAQSMLTD
jgi:hypothetical protein